MYFQVLCNAIWYVTNDHCVINSAALHKKDVKPIPLVFEDYTGYNEIRRKKLKSLPLTQTSLVSHGEALYSLLLKPIFRSTEAWSKAADDVKQLADCLISYSEHLKMQAQVSSKNQQLDHPVRTIDENATVEHRHKHPFGVKNAYIKYDEDIIRAGPGNPVIFDESKHLISPFNSNTERFRFITELQLYVPVDVIKFSPGGSVVTTLAAAQVEGSRTDSELL